MANRLRKIFRWLKRLTVGGAPRQNIVFERLRQNDNPDRIDPQLEQGMREWTKRLSGDRKYRRGLAGLYIAAIKREILREVRQAQAQGYRFPRLMQLQHRETKTIIHYRVDPGDDIVGFRVIFLKFERPEH